MPIWLSDLIELGNHPVVERIVVPRTHKHCKNAKEEPGQTTNIWHEIKACVDRSLELLDT